MAHPFGEIEGDREGKGTSEGGGSKEKTRIGRKIEGSSSIDDVRGGDDEYVQWWLVMIYFIYVYSN